MTLSVKPDLAGRVAIVTGAGRGIGRIVAEALAGCGASVVVAARTESQVAEVAGAITAAGGRAMAVRADIGCEQDVAALFAAAIEEFGRLDVLVNNAGIGRYGQVAEMVAEDIDDMLKVNLLGTLLCCREAMKVMISAGSGYIINVSSVLGFKGYPNQAAYTATKHGVMGLTKSLAVEAQEYGIRVSAILPGGVDTEMVRRSRPDLDPAELLSRDDIAQSILYLLSLSDTAAVDQIYIRRRNSTPF